MKIGDIVQLRCAGCVVEATIVIASDNGRSLMLTFEAILDGHVGMMPVVREADDDVYRAVMTGTPVVLIPR